jgi:hypothetical protein
MIEIVVFLFVHCLIVTLVFTMFASLYLVFVDTHFRDKKNLKISIYVPLAYNLFFVYMVNLKIVLRRFKKALSLLYTWVKGYSLHKINAIRE